MNTANRTVAIQSRPAAPIRYIASDIASKPAEFIGVQCKKCKSKSIFASRTTIGDVPMKLLGFVPCRCGGCLQRFFTPFWRARKRS